MHCSSAHKVRLLFCCTKLTLSINTLSLKKEHCSQCQNIDSNSSEQCGLQGMLWGPLSMHGEPH